MTTKDPEIDAAEENRRYNATRLEDQEMQIYSMFLMAAMAGGVSAKKSAKEADDALAILKSRYT